MLRLEEIERIKYHCHIVKARQYVCSLHFNAPECVPNEMQILRDLSSQHLYKYCHLMIEQIQRREFHYR